jgi:Arylsulfotransferase (ASST)
VYLRPPSAHGDFPALVTSGAARELDSPSMRRVAVVVVLVLATLAMDGAATPVGAQGAPTRTVTATGTGVSTYPTFNPAITRYGVRTTEGTAGSITVTATTTDPGGVITVNGRPATSGVGVAVTDLVEGDEVAVRIADAGGTTSYALVYLPVGLPTMTATSFAEGPEDGLVFLTLNSFVSGPRFEAAVDRHGVPVFVRTVTIGSNDFKRQPDGRYSIARPTTTPGRTGDRIVALDSTFAEVQSYETVAPLTTTDFHDSVLRPDGTALLMSYQADSPRVDSVIQELAPDGSVAFTWDSDDHIPVSDGLVGGSDYAHINSMEYLPDGDILASFRNPSQVLRIARTAHDGFQVGDVVWRLGGVSSDFTFEDDPEGGFCAQHTAHWTDDGHLMVFDNGAQADPGSPFGVQTGDICPDPEDPEARRARPFSRVAEYELDTEAMTATLVWSYAQAGIYTPFAGSAQRVAGGNTLVGWVNSSPIATEVDPEGDKVWELTIGSGYISYRSLKFGAPDATDPEAVVAAPAEGATYGQGAVIPADFGCTDRGGSNLAGCTGTVAPGAPLDTSTPGTHTFTVTATDGAGNSSEVTRTYDVLVGPHQPDGVIKRRARGPWRGDGRYGRDGAGQTVVLNGRRGGVLTALVMFQDDGTEVDTLRLRGARNTAAFQVRFFRGATDISPGVKAGTFETWSLEPGDYYPLRVEVRVRPTAPPGAEQRIRLTGTSIGEPARTDTVVVVARAIG